MNSIIKFLKSIFFRKSYKELKFEKNTFILWEPCSKSHAEVLTGYAKYLLDLGYNVCVFFNDNSRNKGLFSRIKTPKLSFSGLNKSQTRAFFKNSNLKNVEGVLVTTIGKLCDEINFDESFTHFNENAKKEKIFAVSHDAKNAIDNKSWSEDLITLRKLNYKGAESVVVNPHYFGEIKVTAKNTDIVNFITVGAIRAKRKSSELIINAVQNLHNKGFKNFKVTVIGKGSLKNLPKELQPYFDLKGACNFAKLYEEMEKADFMLSSYDQNNESHLRYNTVGTSGNFQLVYGFLKPCIILSNFAELNGFNDENAILYKTNADYTNAMLNGIEMSPNDYDKMQKNLKSYVDGLYSSSKENLVNLIAKRQRYE